MSIENVTNRYDVYKVDGELIIYDKESEEPPILPPGIKTISYNFLTRFSNLTKPPIIPPSVTNIDDHFLFACSGLTEPPIIPLSVTRIGCSFLSLCRLIETPPIIPVSVISIGNSFLYGCENINEPPRISSSTTVDPIGFCESAFRMFYTLNLLWDVEDLPTLERFECYWKRKDRVRDKILQLILSSIPIHIL